MQRRGKPADEGIAGGGGVDHLDRECGQAVRAAGTKGSDARRPEGHDAAADEVRRQARGDLLRSCFRQTELCCKLTRLGFVHDEDVDLLQHGRR